MRKAVPHRQHNTIAVIMQRVVRDKWIPVRCLVNVVVGGESIVANVSRVFIGGEGLYRLQLWRRLNDERTEKTSGLRFIEKCLNYFKVTESKKRLYLSPWGSRTNRIIKSSHGSRFSE